MTHIIQKMLEGFDEFKTLGHFLCGNKVITFTYCSLQDMVIIAEHSKEDMSPKKCLYMGNAIDKIKAIKVYTKECAKLLIKELDNSRK